MVTIFLGLIAAFAWGLHDILVRYVSNKSGILVSLFLVLLFGVFTQLPLVLALADSSAVSLEMVWYSIAAGVAFAAAGIGHYNAFSRGPVRLVAPLISCYSVLAFILAAASGETVSTSNWLALGLLLGGIALVARSSDEDPVEDTSYNTGMTVIYCLIAMAGFSLTFEMGQNASQAGDPLIAGIITRSVSTISIGTVILLVLARKSFLAAAPSPAETSISFSWPNGQTLMVLIFMASLDAIALGTVMAAGIFPQPEFASATSSIFGLVTVVLAWIFLKEKINLIQWLGIVFVFVAIVWLALR